MSNLYTRTSYYFLGENYGGPCQRNAYMDSNVRLLDSAKADAGRLDCYTPSDREGGSVYVDDTGRQMTEGEACRRHPALAALLLDSNDVHWIVARIAPQHLAAEGSKARRQCAMIRRTLPAWYDSGFPEDRARAIREAANMRAKIKVGQKIEIRSA